MATPQEVLQSILARLAQQAPATGTPAPNNPIVGAPVSPGVVPTTTTGLGGVAPAVPGGNLTELLKSTLAAYQQGGQNVGNIYDATSQNFVNPGNEFLLKLITALMGSGLTEDQIMSDPTVMGYISNMNSLLGNTAQNEATDLSWFEKMGAASANALGTPVMGGGSGGGGGGGGGGGRRGGGGGGGSWGYSRGGYGGGGGGYGSDDLSTKTTGYFQETAKEVFNEYAPNFNADTLAMGEASGLNPDQMELLSRILDASGNNPRQLNKDAVAALNALDLSIEEDTQPLNVIAQRRLAQQQNAVNRANDQKQALIAAFDQNWQDKFIEPDEPGPDFWDRVMNTPQINNVRGVGGVVGGMLDAIGSPVFGGPRGSIDPNIRVTQAPQRGNGEIPPAELEKLRQKILKAYLIKAAQRMNPASYSKNLDALPKTEYDMQGQIIKPTYDEAGHQVEFDLNGNPVPSGRSLNQMRKEMNQALSERAVWDLARDIAHQRDPNISPNITQRQVVAQGQNKTQQTAYPNDGDYGYNDVLIPNQPEELAPSVLTGMAGQSRSIEKNAAIQKLLSQRLKELREHGEEDDALIKTKPFKDPAVRVSDLIRNKIPQKMYKPTHDEADYTEYRPTGYDGGANSRPRLYYENGGYKVAVPMVPDVKAPNKVAVAPSKPKSTSKPKSKSTGVVKSKPTTRVSTSKSKSNVPITKFTQAQVNRYRKTLQQKEKGKGF